VTGESDRFEEEDTRHEEFGEKALA